MDSTIEFLQKLDDTYAEQFFAVPLGSNGQVKSSILNEWNDVTKKLIEELEKRAKADEF